MASYWKIPLLAATPDQTLSIDLDDTTYRLRVVWNETGGFWAMDLLTADDAPILLGVKMVKNYPLTGNHRNALLPFGDFYFVEESGFIPRPDFDCLGVSHFLYYVEPDVTAATAPALSEPIAPSLGTAWDGGLSAWDGGATEWDM